MTIYVINTANERIEFLDEQAAIDYAAENSLPEPVSEEKELPVKVAIIQDVTPRQMRQALVISGITIEAVEAALDSLPEPIKTLARIEWEYSVAFQRNRPLCEQVGIMLGKTSDELDALWRFAASLP